MWKWSCPSGFGSPTTYHEHDGGHGFGDGPRPARASALIARWVPARAGLALLFGAAAKRVGCGPTWVVLTWGCRGAAAEMKAVYPGEKDRGMGRREARGSCFRRDVV